MPHARSIQSVSAPESSEAADRLANIRQALRLADMMAGKTASQVSNPAEFEAAGIDVQALHHPSDPLAVERVVAELRVALPHIEELLAGR